MPVNFDQDREKDDREFIIRGQTFKIKRIRPEAMDKLDELEEEFDKIEDKKFSDSIRLAESRLLLLIDDGNGAIERWKLLREDENDPIEYDEIIRLSKLAFEKVTGLPTLLLSTSGAVGGETTDDSSSAGSS